MVMVWYQDGGRKGMFAKINCHETSLFSVNRERNSAQMKVGLHSLKRLCRKKIEKNITAAIDYIWNGRP